VLVLGSKDSESAGVQPEVLVPEALGRVDGEMDARYVDMGMENGTIFQCEELELLAGVNRAQRKNCRSSHANVLGKFKL
jgi:hypothetical protein